MAEFCQISNLWHYYDTSLLPCQAFFLPGIFLGLVAYRVGKKLDYDGATGRVTNSAEGDDLLKPKYRPGSTLRG